MKKFNQEQRLFLKEWAEKQIEDITYDYKKYSFERVGERKKNNLFRVKAFKKLIKMLK